MNKINQITPSFRKNRPLRQPAVSTNKDTRLKLTDRDYAILIFVATNRFVTSRQIRDLFWQAADTHNHYSRLRKLVRAGLLEYLVGDNSSRLGYRLTQKGIDVLPSEILKAKAISHRSFSYRTSFDHDKLLQAIRGVIEKSPLVSGYMPEHEVRSLLALRHGKEEKKDSGYKVPDGLFELKTDKKTLRVAIELELTMKSEVRYRKIFRELLTSTDFDVVFTIAANERMTEALVAIANQVKANDPIVRDWPKKRGLYFATLEKVLSEGQKAIFKGDGPPFSLGSLETRTSKKPQGQHNPNTGC